MGAPDDPDDSGTLGERAGAVKDRASGALGSVQDRASGAVDTVTDAPRQVQRKTRGNPLAAGLIAFGIGYLISGAIPATREGAGGRQPAAGQGRPADRQGPGGGQRGRRPAAGTGPGGRGLDQGHRHRRRGQRQRPRRHRQGRRPRPGPRLRGHGQRQPNDALTVAVRSAHAAPSRFGSVGQLNADAPSMGGRATSKKGDGHGDSRVDGRILNARTVCRVSRPRSRPRYPPRAGCRSSSAAGRRPRPIRFPCWAPGSPSSASWRSSRR